MARIKSYGMWRVTTEGDCEGRSIKDLGIHEGHLDDIAFALAGSCFYVLTFRPVNPSEWHRNPPGTEVCVALDISSKTWDMNGDARACYFKQLLTGRDVTVEAGNYYASARLIRGSDPTRRESARQDALRSAALAKLSDEELTALGVKP